MTTRTHPSTASASNRKQNAHKDKHPTALSSAQSDRVAGTLVGLACGDALGAAYEFQSARIHGEPVGMVGGGSFGWEPGEWTDDTSMAVCIAEIAATGTDLRSCTSLDRILEQFLTWSADAKDIGIQTSNVLSYARSLPTTGSAALTMQYARELFERTGKTGNGSLMRTAPVALACWDNPETLDEVVYAVSNLTHGDKEAGEACALWCHAIAHAVKYGSFGGLRLATNRLPADRKTIWNERLDEAERLLPHEIPHNGWVVAALMAAWSAIAHTPVPEHDPAAGTYPSQHFALATEAAVRAGDDTDTVAAIAGALLGARWGISAIPLQWQRVLHGYPKYRSRDLVRVAMLSARHGEPDPSGWPTKNKLNYGTYVSTNVLVQHPHDDKVWLSGVDHAHNPPEEVNAVVSLCRLGKDEVPARGVTPENHVEVWLIDNDFPTSNINLDHTLMQAADMIHTLRQEGHTVLLHCVQAHSRTPTVAALYSTRHIGVPAPQALTEVRAALPESYPNKAFLAALNRLG